ncbi:MAG TPA: chemotaxis protein CheX [Spirochaetia bacterium]|nr:chemotaxis protein CheX [Spirochaetia bacterium]
MNESFEIEKARTALLASVQGTFAEMVFTDVTLSSLGEISDVEDSCASIDILKPLSTQVVCLFPRALIEKFMEILIPDHPANVQEKDDSVLELLNIIAGNFLTNYFGHRVDSKLQLPQFHFGAVEGEGVALFVLNLDAEGIPFRVALRSVRYTY